MKYVFGLATAALIGCLSNACSNSSNQFDATGSGGGSDAGAAGNPATGGSAGSGGSGGTPSVCGTGPLAPDGRPLPAEMVNAAPDLEPRAGSERLEIWVRHASTLDATKIGQFGARTCQALAFNFERLELAATQPEVLPAVRLVLLDDAAYGVATGDPGTYGMAFAASDGAGDAMVLRESAIDDPVTVDDTLAHELNHIVVDRFTPTAELPLYATEGLAIGMGSHFGKREHDQPTDFVKGWLDDATGADAALTFSRYDLEDLTTGPDEIGHDQAISAFFVEYLRVKLVHSGGTGIPNAHVAFFTAMRDANTGAAFASGFANRMGIELEPAKLGFAQFLDDTSDDPTARFGGTVFE